MSRISLKSLKCVIEANSFYYVKDSHLQPKWQIRGEHVETSELRGGLSQGLSPTSFLFFDYLLFLLDYPARASTEERVLIRLPKWTKISLHKVATFYRRLYGGDVANGVGDQNPKFWGQLANVAIPFPGNLNWLFLLHVLTLGSNYLACWV